MKKNDAQLAITKDPKIRLAILQRVCPAYRTALFSALTTDESLHMKLFIGADIPHSKVKSTPHLEGINYTKLKTGFVKIGRRTFPVQKGLVRALKEFNPDVILCEGESHFIGYLQAIWYQLFFSRKTALIHWCFISLPGEPLEKGGIVDYIKKFTRRFFNAFLLYSSYSKKALLSLGIPAEKAFVATNVGDVKKFLRISYTIRETKQEARLKLQLEEKFTVLYTGTLDKNKKPDLVLDLAKGCPSAKFNFILLGAGEMFDELKRRIEAENLTNVYLPGRVTDELHLYYRASDVLILPGRGGIIISEAMAFGIPVIVHEADGTEYDLVLNDKTGYILEKGDVSDFCAAIEKLESSPDVYRDMSRNSKILIETTYTTENMTQQIVKASTFARNSRIQTLAKN